MAKKDKDRQPRAQQLLTRLQKALLRRLAAYVVENEASLRRAADGAEGYGFTLHQLDELFLSRLNLIERTIAELQKSPAHGASRYRSMVFSASREAVEQEINSHIEKIPNARILGVTVSPSAAPSRATYLDFGLPDDGPPGGSAPPEEPDVRVAKRPPVATSVAPPHGRPEDAEAARESGPDVAFPDDLVLDENDDGDEEDDELLVTVLYYGPTPAPEA
jgi:hypothetical protein